jgi:acyl-CoA thioesterase FadM
MRDSHRLAHVERIPIRWGDMDTMGRVNNTTYVDTAKQMPLRIPEAMRERLLAART